MECLQFGTDDPMTYFRLAHNLREKNPERAIGSWRAKRVGRKGRTRETGGKSRKTAAVRGSGEEETLFLLTVNIRFNIAIIGNFEE